MSHTKPSFATTQDLYIDEALARASFGRRAYDKQALASTCLIGAGAALVIGLAGVVQAPRLFLPILGLSASSAWVLAWLGNRASIEAACLERAYRACSKTFELELLQPKAQTVTIDPPLPALPALPPSSPESPPQAPASPSYSIPQDLGRNPQSALIAGVPGSGKGVVVYAALAELAIHHPEVKVFFVDPKASPVESGSDELKTARVYRFPILQANPGQVSDWVNGIVQDFRDHIGPKLLVLDEWSALTATLKDGHTGTLQTVRGLISHITSMGDSERAYLWLVSQDASVEGIGISQALRANLRAIALVTNKNKQSVQVFLRSGWVAGFEPGELDDLISQSPVNRAIFDGALGRWEPCPRYPNLTGYDRDARVNLLPPSTPVEVPRPLSTEAAYVLDWLVRRGQSRATANELSKISKPLKLAQAQAVFDELQTRGYGSTDPDGKGFQLTQPEAAPNPANPSQSLVG